MIHNFFIEFLIESFNISQIDLLSNKNLNDLFPPKSSNNSDDYIKLKKEIGTKLDSFLGGIKKMKDTIDSSGKGEKDIIATLTKNMKSIKKEEKRKETLKEILDKMKIINNLDFIDYDFELKVGKISNDDDDIKKKLRNI